MRMNPPRAPVKTSGGGGHWQKGEAVGSKPLNTSFSEALSCSAVLCSACTGLLPPNGLPVPPGLAACFTAPNKVDTGRADFRTNRGSLDLGLVAGGSLGLDSTLAELGELLEPLPAPGLPGLLVLGSYRLMLLSTLAPPAGPAPTPRPAPPEENILGS
ncbi:hypothetical protein F7725_020414 [Dissostichus mawsoni]|uniref:Uncharacterized protein n=1 Tax=Dissostichus mawsoni TaxID=36200 RepID=A0A7J5YD49_DISMA|nr:hypothetical protein F7725_020414 [Dissostichus mawsoni]